MADPRRARRASAAAGLALFGLAAYLAFAPVPIEPVAWQAPPDPGYVGPQAPNERLAGLRLIDLRGEEGPEHVLPGPDGRLYAAVASGAILRLQPDGGGLERWVETGGRTLGFAFDATGTLIAADALRGLLAVHPDGQVELLADQAEGQPILYADAVAVARSGRVFFTDASRRFAPRRWGGTFEASLLDILEHSCTGRVLELEPLTRRVRVVLRDLCFANGLALSSDERSLFVAETGAYRVWQVDADARGASARTPGGAARVLLDNLPGYPDNLTRGRDGRVWLGLVKPRGAVVDRLAGWPALRRAVLRLPRALWPVPPARGHVLAFDEGGQVVADLQDPAGRYPETTGVTEIADRLYVQSLHARTLGWLPAAEVLGVPRREEER